MQRVGRFSSLLVLAGLLISCAPPAPETLTDADTEAIRSSSAAWDRAFSVRDWEGVAAFYTEDAALMPPNAPAVKGRAAIAEFFSQTPPFSASSLEITEIDGRGNLALVTGTFSMTITMEGMPPFEDVGKWVEVRYRQADGSWLIHRDIYNSDAAPAMEK